MDLAIRKRLAAALRPELEKQVRFATAESADLAALLDRWCAGVVSGIPPKVPEQGDGPTDRIYG